MSEKIILSRLLDKYEKSKHLLEPGVSTRRVMLRVDKKDLPEYKYEDAETRDSYNRAAQTLEEAGLITAEWVRGGSIFSALILNLDHVEAAYQRVGRVHPKTLAQNVSDMVSTSLENVSCPWILHWRDAICEDAQVSYRVPTFCKKGLFELENLLIALKRYDSLNGESITMRTFSSLCYHDTKYFERNVRDLFLRIAVKYHADLAEASNQSDMGVREQLAFLGIYARPELYELAGDCQLETPSGWIDFSAASSFGIALPSTMVDSIVSFDLSEIRKIVFVENKTNYDEYLLSELSHETLAIFHGGFLSPQKRKLIAKLAQFIPADAEVFFWADIDLGGFRMFSHLQSLLPQLLPLRMSASDVSRYQSTGLKRDQGYLNELQELLSHNQFPQFQETMQQIISCGVTIEQEVFLS